MAEDRGKVGKEVADRFGLVEETAKSVAVWAKDLQVSAMMAKKDLEKAKDDNLDGAISKAIEPVTRLKDNILKEVKAIEKHLADVKKAAASAKK